MKLAIAELSCQSLYVTSSVIWSASSTHLLSICLRKTVATVALPEKSKIHPAKSQNTLTQIHSTINMSMQHQRLSHHICSPVPSRRPPSTGLLCFQKKHNASHTATRLQLIEDHAMRQCRRRGRAVQASLPIECPKCIPLSGATQAAGSIRRCFMVQSRAESRVPAEGRAQVSSAL